MPCSVAFSLPLAKGREAHYHRDGHDGNKGGVEFHYRHRNSVRELLHVYYSRVNHRSAAVYGRGCWLLIVFDYF